MLLIDRDHVRLSDLMAIDPEVGEVADAEGITVEGDEGIVREAWETCADMIRATFAPFIGGNPPRVRPDQVVASGTVKRWIRSVAIELFWRAASNRRESDRYARKLELAIEDVRRKWGVLARGGVPVAWFPVPCPGALHVDGAGEFCADNVSTVAMLGAVGAKTYAVAITWTRGAVESAPSEAVEVVALAGEIPIVDCCGLTVPASVDGWNVYIGTPGGVLHRQNADPLDPFRVDPFVLPGDPVESGVLAGDGQALDKVDYPIRTFFRG
jgi:hypothetical protein